MNTDIIMKNIEMSLTRLNRSFDQNLNGFDEAALLDLAHHLRLWVDMQKEVHLLGECLKLALPLFGYSLTSRCKKILHPRTYIFSMFPNDGITIHGTFPPKEQFNIDFSSVGNDFGDKFQVYTRFSHPNLENITFYNFRIIGGVLEKDEVETLLYKSSEIRRYDFLSWMKSEVVRTRLSDTQKLPFIISREKLIERVANMHGGSHPIGHEPREYKENEIVDYLMRITVNKIPVIYLILMNTAKQILSLKDILLTSKSVNAK